MNRPLLSLERVFPNNTHVYRSPQSDISYYYNDFYEGFYDSDPMYPGAKRIIDSASEVYRDIIYTRLMGDVDMLLPDKPGLITELNDSTYKITDVPVPDILLTGDYSKFRDKLLDEKQED